MDGIYEKAHKMTKKICSKYKDIDYKTQFKLCLSYLSDENINKRIKEILAEVKVNEEEARILENVEFYYKNLFQKMKILNLDFGKEKIKEESIYLHLILLQNLI